VTLPLAAAAARLRGKPGRPKTRPEREGLTVKGRAHPATVIERDARLAMLRALRSLNLDLEPLRDRPGRPPGR